MKKAIKRLLQVGAFLGVFAGGYYVNDISKNIESNVQAETIKEQVTDELKASEGYNLSTIPNDKDNIFTQYFTVSEIKDNVVYVTNTYFKEDFQIVEKSDLASLKYEVGTKLAITYNHDDIQEIEYDNHKTYIYNITDSKEYGIELDNEKYVFGVNPLDSADFVTLEKKTYVIGDMVKVTYKEGSNTEIEKDGKIGRWRETDEEIQKNEVTPEPQNNEVVKQKEVLQNAVKQETQKIEKVKQNEEKPKTEQKQVKKEESTEKQKPAKTEQKQDSKQDNSFLENDPKRANSEKEFTIDEESQEKLIHASNGNEKYLLENNGYKKGDKVKVTFGGSGYHDDIVKQEKVSNDSKPKKDPNEGKQGYIKDGNGKWITEKEYDDMAFKENAETDPNRNNPNYVQTEDGSFVPKNFWDWLSQFRGYVK